MSASTLGRAFVLAASAATVALMTPAARTSAATGRASATILQAIAVTEATPMSFAEVAPPPGGGIIVLTPTGTISSSGGFVFRGAAAAGIFHARGVPNHPATVSFSGGNTVIGPGPAMRVATFTNNAAATFDSAANLNFAVGATLVVNPNQAPGQYSGTYAVTVNF